MIFISFQFMEIYLTFQICLLITKYIRPSLVMYIYISKKKTQHIKNKNCFKKAKSEYEDGTELQNPGFLSYSQQKLSQQTRD